MQPFARSLSLRPNWLLNWTLPLAPADRRQVKVDVLRVLIVANLLLGFYYLSWRWLESINWAAWWFAVPLVLAETYSYIDAWLFGLTLWRLQERSEQPPPPANVTVDVFVTRYNESAEVVRPSLRGARGIFYPHRTYLLDDGDSPEMRDLAVEEGVDYLTRTDDWKGRPRHAKAGNLANALMRTEGEFILVLDADQVARPRIVERLLGYFQDPQVAFVQTPQLFGNVPTGDPFGSQAPLFYGPIQQGKDGWNAAFFCGSNAILRREALLQLGVIGYVNAMTSGLREVLQKAGQVLTKAARRARREGDQQAADALLELRRAATAAEQAVRRDESIQEVTYAFQRTVEAVSRQLVARDLEQIRSELDGLPDLAADLGVEATEATDDEEALSILSRREWSPLGAIESVRSLLRSVDVDRGDQALPVLPLVTISITEDMATALELHSLGWRSVYHQELLAVGLAPEDLRSALQQRLRWAQGSIQVLLRDPPLLKRGLGLGQRLMYWTTMWTYLAGFPAVAFLAGPALFLLFGVSPVRAWSPDFFWHLLPYLIVNQTIFLIIGWRKSTWRGQQYSLALFALWIQAVISATGNVVLGRRLGFVVTSKTRVAGAHIFLVWPQLAAMALLGAGVVAGLVRLALGVVPDTGPTLVNVVWACYDLALLSVVLDAALLDPGRRGGELEPMRI